jgi:hypothetical protein
MRIHRVQVKRFRGIKELLWEPGDGIVCLVGPGDSMKTTILDAIEYALLPRWSIPFTDVDFFGTKARDDEPIEIHVTIGDVPGELLKEDRFGMYLRGWPLVETRDDEPEDNCQPVLTVRLRVVPPPWLGLAIE